MAIHQPNLFPRLKTLQKLASSDIWIVLDDVQFAARDYQHRALLSPLGGSTHWMTLPIDRSRGTRLPINSVELRCDDPYASVARHLEGAFGERDARIVDLLAKVASHLEDPRIEQATPLIRIAVSSTLALLSLGRAAPMDIAFASSMRVSASPKAAGIRQLLSAFPDPVIYLADSGARRYMVSEDLAGVVQATLWQQEVATTNGSRVRNSAICDYIADTQGFSLLLQSGIWKEDVV